MIVPARGWHWISSPTASHQQLGARADEASAIGRGDAVERADWLSLLEALGDRGRVDGLGHGAQHGACEHDLVDLLAPKDLNGEGDVVRVLLGRGLERERARALGLLGRAATTCVDEARASCVSALAR